MSEDTATMNLEGKFTQMDADGWNERWKQRKIGFHKEAIHPLLEKHVDQLIKNRKNIRVFFPMCGKALDMKWIADQGHTVIGVEYSEMAIQEFFNEQGLEYTVEPVAAVDGKVFKSKDGSIHIYCCDIFKFNKDIAGQFNAIWDRGALVAINRGERQKYSVLMKSLMASDCQYLLDTFDYNEDLYAGPPHYVPEKQIPELYSDMCDIEHVTTIDALEDKHRNSWGLDYFHERIHLITLKN